MKKDSQNSNTVKTWKGEVVSDKPEQTVVVSVSRVIIHPVYKKRRTVSKRYQVHDPENRFKVGDKVSFVQCKPVSKHKRWQVVYDN